MKIYIPRNYSDAVQLLRQQPQAQRLLTADQATRIKSIMDRTAQEIKKITGTNPGAIVVNANDIVFVKRYEVTQQILVGES